jgi:hypothetical protein
LSSPVSVLIPTYNAERFIRKAVESVLVQSHSDFELVVIDNASTDATPEILQEYASSDKRVRILQNEENIGFQRSINRGLRAAKHEYVAKLDAPDWMPIYRLVQQASFLDDHPAVAVVGGDSEFYDAQYTAMGCRRLSKHYLPVEMLFGCYLSHSAVMYRRSILLRLGGYREDLIRAEDYDMWIRLLQNGYQLVNLPKIMSFELVFEGQGADFHVDEEFETVRNAKMDLMRTISGRNLPPFFEPVVSGICCSRITGGVPPKEVHACTKFLCGQFIGDLLDFFPYIDEGRARGVIRVRLKEYIKHNLLSRHGQAVLKAARAEGLDPGRKAMSTGIKYAGERALRFLSKI